MVIILKNGLMSNEQMKTACIHMVKKCNGMIHEYKFDIKWLENVESKLLFINNTIINDYDNNDTIKNIYEDCYKIYTEMTNIYLYKNS